MPSRNVDKNKDVIKELEKKISPVLVVNNSSLKPYVELFEYAPENIYKQPLGTLVGFFEIKEYSEDSAYIVNFLTSVLKKEYFMNPRRPVTESFDAALHKVNLALSELAKHGNIEWLGKLNAAICVLEKNSMHFSVAGGAQLFLFRNQTLTDISEDLASDELEPHPLKTFVNVSSGRLEKNDRVLITTDDIFHILSINELKKNFDRLEKERFVQFLKTALSNQLEMSSSIVIDIQEPAPIKKEKALPKKKLQKNINAFSEKAFATESMPAVISTFQTDTAEAENDQNAYTDKKTGHIYIQGEARDDQENRQVQIYWEIAKEKIAEGWFLGKQFSRRKFILLKKQLAKKIEQQRQLRAEKKQARDEELLQLKEEKRYLEEQAQKHIPVIQENDDVVRKSTAAAQQEIDDFEDVAPAVYTETIVTQRKSVIDLKNVSKTEELTVETIITEQLEDDALFEEISYDSDEDGGIQPSPKLEKLISLYQHTSKSLLGGIHRITTKLRPVLAAIDWMAPFKKLAQTVPHFSKIKTLFARLTTRQKAYTALALIAIFIVPLFIAHWLNRPKAPTITSLQAPVLTLADTLAYDKNIHLQTSTNTILSKTNIIATLIANGTPAVITKNSIILIQNGNQKEYPFPDNSGSALRGAYMQDLALILILTDQHTILSFSPNSLKYTPNNIDLQGVSQKSFIGTYMTYMYVLDPEANQIYRYPRADGGFGEKTSWYKDTLSLSQTSGMTIDDNIYCIENNNQVIKFFKGKKQDFKLEATNTPVQFNQIYTTTDSENFFALDTKNDRVLQYDKNGTIIAQFYNEKLSSATSFAVDEQNHIAYIANTSGLLSLQLQ